MGMLDGKTALVTAAGGGIAGAIARKFATEGAAVCCVDVNEETVTRRRSQISKRRVAEQLPRVCNVADEAAVKTTVDRNGRGIWQT